MSVLLSMDVIAKGIVSAVIGYLVWRLKVIEKKAEKSMTREDVRQLVEDKMAPFIILHEAHSRANKRIEDKLDMLIERSMK